MRRCVLESSSPRSRSKLTSVPVPSAVSGSMRAFVSNSAGDVAAVTEKRGKRPCAKSGRASASRRRAVRIFMVRTDTVIIATPTLMNTPARFCLVLVKPSHYDDDGYVIQWFRSAIPSNSLAALYGLARDCAARKILGDVELEIHPIDET